METRCKSTTYTLMQVALLVCTLTDAGNHHSLLPTPDVTCNSLKLSHQNDAAEDPSVSPPAKKARTFDAEAPPAHKERLMRAALLSSTGVQDGAVLHLLPYDGVELITVSVKVCSPCSSAPAYKVLQQHSICTATLKL